MSDKTLQNIETQANSLVNRIVAAIEHPQPSTFAFTIGVQLGALRSRIRRVLNSYVEYPKGIRTSIGAMDDCCFDIETSMIDAMALTFEQTQQREHLELARQKATTICNLVQEARA